MNGFELLPVGTTAKLEQLEAYARKASDTLARLGAGGQCDVPRSPIGEQSYADPLFCEARVAVKIRNSRGRYGPIR